LSRKERFAAEVERTRIRAQRLREEGLSDDAIVKQLLEERFWPTAISKVMHVSGRDLQKLRGRGDTGFVSMIESIRRDPKVPIIAREIDDYAWWRRVCYNLGIQSFYRLSPLAGLTVEDQKNPELALTKLTKVQTDMFDLGEKAVEINRENERLRRELEEWRVFAKAILPRLDRLKEVCESVRAA